MDHGEVKDNQDFHSLCKELFRKLLERMRCNVAGENFMPRTAPYEVLDSHVAKVSRLLELITAKMREGFPWSSQNLADPADVGDAHKVEFGQWLSNIVKRPGHASPKREQRVATVLAILLEVHAHLPSQPGSEAWRAFTASCMRYETHAELRDGRLPLSRRLLCNLLGRRHGLLFYGTQFDYCSPVVKWDARLDLRNRRSDAPLPYLSENYIGGGAYGEVYKVEIAEGHVLTVSPESMDHHYSENPLTYARKDIAIQPSKNENFTEEWNVIQLIRERFNRHPWDHHLMQTLACFHFSDSISLFMRLADRGDLAEFMSSEQRPIYPKDQWYLEKIVDIANALTYLHHFIKDEDGNAVVCFHLDLKPENILVILEPESNNFVFKLADFSISRIKKTSTSEEVNLTTDYAAPREQHASRGPGRPSIITTKSRLGDASSCIAPEGLFGGRVSQKSDVWGYGCVLAIFLSWLCEGPSGVQNFMNERVQQSGGQHDRFFVRDMKQRSRNLISTAVSAWLADVCLQTTRMEENPMYHAVCQCLRQLMLLVDASDRAIMTRIQQELTRIASGEASKWAQGELPKHHSVSPTRQESFTPNEDDSRGQGGIKIPSASDMDEKVLCNMHPQPALDVIERYSSINHLEMADFKQTHFSHDDDLVILEFATRVEAILVSGNGQLKHRISLTAGATSIKRVLVTAKYIYIIPRSPTFKLYCFRIDGLFRPNRGNVYILEGPMRQPDHILVDLQSEDVVLACYSVSHHYLEWSAHLLSLQMPTSGLSLAQKRIATHKIAAYLGSEPATGHDQLQATGQHVVHFAGTQLYVLRQELGSQDVITSRFVISRHESHNRLHQQLIRWKPLFRAWSMPHCHDEMRMPYSMELEYGFEALVQISAGCPTAMRNVVGDFLVSESQFNRTLGSLARASDSVHLLLFESGFYAILRHVSGRHIDIVRLHLQHGLSVVTADRERSMRNVELPVRSDRIKSMFLHRLAYDSSLFLMLVDVNGEEFALTIER